MDPAEWQRVKDVFDAALQREPSQRHAYVGEVCVGDAGLRAEVLSLLASFDQANSFIGLSPPNRPRASVEAPDVVTSVGRRVGPYQLLREIGQGGMGTVYLAARADQLYHKRVAVKLIQPGLNSHEIIRRVQQERQMLAALDHPNIVKLVDGGTTEDGLPFLVMDYVEGVPIDRHCDRYRLSTTERLRLFLHVCAAVQCAHQSLVVHRDLKPSNILVTSKGEPRLLDFGIAKLLNPGLSPVTFAVTRTAERPMTLEYASPEQIRGEPITTATDVYALGVILYRLLTGRSPYHTKASSPLELEHAICEAEPEKPSTAITRAEERSDPGGTRGQPPTPEIVIETCQGDPDRLRKRLTGDLDMIVLMALRKEPQRRYASVEQLADDIGRHLATRPVVARKPTFDYRATKFVRRNRVGVIAAGLVALALVGGIIGTWSQARVAQAEKVRAERRFNDVRRLANSYLFEFHEAIRDLPGSTAARQLLVKRALEYLDSLAKEARGDPVLQLELGMAYQQIGDIQGNPNNANLGDSQGALDSYRKALGIREVVAAANPANIQARREVGISYERIGDILQKTEGPAAALESYRRNLAITEALMAADPKDARNRRNLSVMCNKVGYMFEAVGDTPGALNYYRKALGLAEVLFAENPASSMARSDMAIGYDNIGDILAKTGDPDGAVTNYQKKLDIFEALAADNPKSRSFQRGLVVSHTSIGDALIKSGNLTGARQSYLKATAIAQTLAVEDPKNAEAQDDLGTSYAGLGTVWMKLGNAPAALDSHRKALAIFEALAWGDPTNRHLRSELSQALVDAAVLIAKAGQTEDARRLTFRGLAILKDQAEQSEATVADLNSAAEAFLTCEPPDLRDPSLALRYAQRAAEKTNGNDPSILATLARASFRNGDSSRAVQTAKQALTLVRARPTGQPPLALQLELEADLMTFEKQ